MRASTASWVFFIGCLACACAPRAANGPTATSPAEPERGGETRPGPGGELQRFCDGVKQRDDAWRAKNRQLSDALTRFDSITSETIGKCWVGKQGAWAIEFEEVSTPPSEHSLVSPKTTDTSGSGRWFVTYHPVEGEESRYEPLLIMNLWSGKAEDGRNFFFNQHAGILVKTPSVFDFDGDGHDELYFPWGQRGPDIEYGKLLSFRRNVIVDYPHFGGMIHDMRDVDGDGRPDVLTHWPFVSFDKEPVAYGPLLCAHSLPDGRFSFEDEVAKQFALRSCPRSPTTVAVESSGAIVREKTLFNGAWGLLWGRTPTDLRTELDATCQRLGLDDSDWHHCSKGASWDQVMSRPRPLGLPSLGMP